MLNVVYQNMEAVAAFDRGKLPLFGVGGLIAWAGMIWVGASGWQEGGREQGNNVHPVLAQLYSRVYKVQARL